MFDGHVFRAYGLGVNAVKERHRTASKDAGRDVTRLRGLLRRRLFDNYLSGC